MGFLNNLINGISLGSIYAVIALGYTLVYGIAKMLNFAHGDIIMVGAYAILTTLFFGVVSGILGTLPVAISFVLTVKYRTLLILPTFVLLNATTYLNILDRNKSSLSWYKYLLLFDDTPKNIIVPLIGVGIIIITIFGFYFYGRNKDKW